MITLLLTLIDTEDMKANCPGHILVLIIFSISYFRCILMVSYEMSHPLWLMNTTHRQMMFLIQNENELWCIYEKKN